MTNKTTTSSARAPGKGIAVVAALQISGGAGQEAKTEFCQIIEEDTLTVEIQGIGRYTLMWTPTENGDGAAGYTDVDGLLERGDNSEALALAAGFVVTEGIIKSLDDIQTMAICPDNPAVVQIVLKNPAQARVTRKDIVITSSCSICGKKDLIDNNSYGLVSVNHKMTVRQQDLTDLMSSMVQRQRLFQQTGGAHAAAIFTSQGQIWSVAEDLGRHNALDKVIGRRLLADNCFDGCGVLLSSRLSMEMLVKVIRAGFEIVAAISAPTSLAVALAQRFGVTLCAFVREDRMTVYTHPERINLVDPTGVGAN